MSCAFKHSSCVVLIVLLAATGSWAQQATPDREIIGVAGNLYRVRDGARHTVFLVTSDGIVLADPLSLNTTQWLKSELEMRFSPGIVRYVLHTVHNVARSEGAGTFNDTAEIVGHRAFNEQLSLSRRGASKTYAWVRDVESYFDDHRAFTSGGRPIEAVHVPLPGAPENAVIVFPSERVAFAADAPFPDATPFRFGPINARAVNRWLGALSALEFDTLLLGNGRSIRKTELNKLSTYVGALIEQVAAEYEAGRSAGEFDESKLPAAYRSDVMFRDWRSNLNDVHRDVALFRIDVAIGGLGNYAVRDNVYCAGYTACSSGGLVPAGVTSLMITASRLSLVAEVAVVEEAFSSRTSRLHDEEFALRETRFSGMAGYNVPAGSVTLRLLGGISHSIAERRGLDRIKLGLAPFAGRHPFASRDSRFAMTGGVDLIVGRRIGLVLPLRFNYAFEEARETWPSKMDAQVGLAVVVRLLRSIE